MHIYSISFRPRMSEMAFVLKAVSTLLVTLKRAPQGNGKCVDLTLLFVQM